MFFTFKLCFFLFTFSLFLSSSSFALFDDAEKKQMRDQITALETEKSKLVSETATLKQDRDNVLKQAKNFLKDKEALLTQMEEMKGATSQSTNQLDSLMKENEILKSEVEKLKAARLRDEQLHLEEKQALEKRVADREARANSLIYTMEKYPPTKIQELVEDHNRLEKENNEMAKRVLDYEKRLEEMRRAMTPLELDRAELAKVREENRELQKQAAYVLKMEERQKQLIRENAEYRERLEVLKSKFKEAVPGLAKSNRISQKMMRENADMHYNLGTIYLHNKEYQQAIKEYEKVLELRPNDPETHYNLGVLYDDYLKDREKAVYHYQKYLAINPKAPDAKKVESYILSLELEQKVR